MQNSQSSFNSNKIGLFSFIENRKNELISKHYTSVDNNLLKQYQSVKYANTQEKALFLANSSSKCTTSHTKRSRGMGKTDKNENILS
jgi:hypothetical protein